MKIRSIRWISLILLLPALFAACGPAATPVPTAVPPTSTPTPLPGIEVTTQGIVLRIVEMIVGKFYGTMRVTDSLDDLGTMGGYQAEPGFHYIQLIIEVPSNESADEISNWPVTLEDTEGNTYEPAIKSWGVLLGGENPVGWTFHIPEGATASQLIFPDEVSADVSPLITK